MNRNRIKEKILLSHFKNESYFKKVRILLDDNVCIVCEKIKTKKDYLDYVKPLTSFYDKRFLLLPSTKVRSLKFVSSVDLIFFDNNYKITKLYPNVVPNTRISLGTNFYSVIIVNNGFIKFNDIKLLSKIKLAYLSDV